jgi:hypothetical protein
MNSTHSALVPASYLVKKPHKAPGFIAHSGVYHEEHQKNLPDKGEVRRMFYWYFVFVFIIPIAIIKLYAFDSLRYYFAIVDIIANIFSNLNNGDLLGRLYSPLPSDLVSYFSTNFLSLLALMGAAWTSIHHAIRLKSVMAGVFLSMILFTFTYLIPVQATGYVMRHFSSMLDNISTFTHQTDSFVTGFGLLLLFMIIENISVYIYFTFLQSYF